MKKGRLLTLSMTETSKNNYQIIGYLYNTFRFVVFTTNRYKDRNKFLLDIGAISNIYYEEGSSEKEIKLTGDIVLDRYLTREEIESFLNDQVIDFSRFKRLKNQIFGVIKIDILEDINFVVNKTLKSYLMLFANGVKEQILIKDFRWLSYWNYIHKLNDKVKLDEREKYYVEFFNKRQVYIILFRYNKNESYETRFKKSNDIYWISGIFYI